MIPLLPLLGSAWRLIKPFWPYLVAVVALLLVGWYFHHRWYSAGYEAAEAEYQAAALKAGVEFARQLEARDRALAEAQGRVVEIVKWKVKTQTVYQNALTTNPDCAAWASEPIRCGLPFDPAGDPGVSADP